MKKGRQFDLIKRWMALGNQHDKAKMSGNAHLLSVAEERMREKQEEYDKLMLDCPMEFRGYTAEKYEWDKNNVVQFFTRWEREDIFLTRASLKRCRQWEKKMNLPPFDEEQEKEAREVKRIKDQFKEDRHALHERIMNEKRKDSE